MQTDYLIIGQGLCGSFLSRELQKAGRSFLVIDESRPFTASKVASGIINPVTGRRIVKTWMIDELLPFAKEAYQSVGEELSIPCISQKNIIDFFPTPQMRLAFIDRYQQDTQYLSLEEYTYSWIDQLRFDFGYGSVQPCYLVDVYQLLSKYRQKLLANRLLMEEHFDPNAVVLTNGGVRYKDISASKIIYCDGIAGAENPLFKSLPFAPNKGEALLVEIKDFTATHIIKKGINIVPWNDDLYWVGSSHEWQFENDQPSALFRERTVQQLERFLKIPFKVVDHWAAVRPATLERRPFVGFHPVHPQVGIFNGMGTKGCSLAPYFAKQLTIHLAQQSAISPEASIDRYRNILMKSK